VQKKNPVLAAVLSLLVTGLGQLYNDDIKKAVILFVAQVVAVFVLLPLLGRFGALINIVIGAYSIYDAYVTAKATQTEAYLPPQNQSW